MSSPDLDTMDVDIEVQQNLRKKIISIDSARYEFLREVQKIRTEDECLRDFKGLLEDLNTERLALVNELRHVNIDINLLEQAIKQAETNRQKTLENAHRVYMNEMIPLCGQINEIRDTMGKDRLPTALVDPSDLEEVFVGDQKSNGVSSVTYDPSSLPSIFPLPLPYGQNAYGQLPALRQPNMFNLFAAAAAAMNNLQQTAATAQTEEAASGRGSNYGAATERTPPAPTAENICGQVGASSLGHVDSVTSGFTLSKQQQPPMKTCTSCQQQIHRNAPICPLCKSKSRSRHPKKKQRLSKSDEAPQE